MNTQHHSTTLAGGDRLAGELEDIAVIARATGGHATASAAFERAALNTVDEALRERRLYLAAAEAQLAGQGDRARRLLLAADDLACRGSPLDSLGLAAAALDRRIYAGYDIVRAGYTTAARAELADLSARLRRAGAVRRLPAALCALAYAEATAGSMAAARDTAIEAIELSLLTGSEAWRYRGLGTQAFVHAVRGEEPQCISAGSQALAMPRPPHRYGHHPAIALGLLEISAGRYDAALERYQETWPSEMAQPPMEDADLPYDLLEACLRTGRRWTPDTNVTVQEPTSEHRPLAAALAWRLLGLAAGEDYARCFTAALELHAEVECPFEASRTRLAFGERLRRAGQRRLAREQLEEALAVFEHITARPWADRTSTELDATAGPGRIPTHIYGELTAQERQVATIVATGATNREVAATLYLSVKTVEFHLRNVFRKLGIRTRAQLAHHVARRTAP